ncbi:tetratricopeptide repeat protein [Taibaiella koreensis]|uniref:tetratricopeptide repeat protein n=1 Tax=Taibaiella koreensis TaxID=1268548 RepID=UPI000E59AECF|nr:tetratricopeptide repeat protein [Taibaiella koreensis]
MFSYITTNYKKCLVTGLLAVYVIGTVSCKQGPGAQEVTVSEGLSVPRLLDRETKTGLPEENIQLRKTYDEAIAALKTNPANLKPYLSLATVFITEGRLTGNNGYYARAALQMLDKVTEGNPSDKNLLFEGLSLKSAVLLNMHQFKAALEVAEAGEKINDYNAGICGALVDANVEMGHYDAAVKACDKMLSIRPDLRSYSRAAYLRQLHGDNNGAREAMRMAVEAGVPGMESTEWARVQWGDLYLNAGKLDTAQMIYNTVLSFRAGYPYAEMGLARVAAADKHYDEAIAHTRNAIRTMSEASFVSYLGDLYLLKGDKGKAMQVYKDVVQQLEQGEREQSGKTLQHNGHRELAMAYLNLDDKAKALEHAKADYAMRPDNIDANDLMAWVLYKMGDYKQAALYTEKVFTTREKNATLSYKAGLIYAAAGNSDKAMQYRSEAAAISPYIDPRITASSIKL